MSIRGEISLEQLERDYETKRDSAERAELSLEIGRRHAEAGYQDKAANYLTSARKDFDATGNHFQRGLTELQLARASLDRGESERAAAYIQRALDTAQTIDNRELEQSAALLQARRALESEDVSRCAAIIDDIGDFFDEVSTADDQRCQYYLLRSALALRQTDLEQAKQAADNACAHADITGSSFWRGRAQRNLAHVAAGAGEFATAVGDFQTSLAIFERAGLTRERAVTYLEFGRFLGKHGRSLANTEAPSPGSQLAAAQEIFKELGNLHDLEGVRYAFRRYGRRATDRVSEAIISQLLEELQKQRKHARDQVQGFSEFVARSLENAPTLLESISDRLLSYETGINAALDGMSKIEQRFVAAINTVIVERENIRSLIELTRSLASIHDRAALNQRVATVAARLANADRAVVVGLTANDELVLRGNHEMPPDEDSWHQDVRTIAFREGKVALLRAERETDIQTRGNADEDLQLGRAVVLPLRRGENVFAAIYVDKQPSGGVFSTHDLDLLTVFAGHAAAVLERIKAQQDLNVAASIKAATLDSVSDAVMSLDLDGRITSMNVMASQLFHDGDDIGQNIDLRKVAGLEFLASCIDNLQEIEGRLVTLKQGEFLCNTRVIGDEDGKPAALVATFTELRRMTNLAQKLAGTAARFTFDDILGRSTSIRRRITLARAAATSSASVLITGPRGTGKHVFAQAIHNANEAGPFVTLNCATTPRDQVESEIFGYEAGAVEGSQPGGRPGKLELATGGSFLLDNIEQLPLDLQTKLLSALQANLTRRVGGSKQMPFSCRVLATTSVDLRTEVARGLFSDQLYRELRPVQLDLPPLRERIDDVPILAEHFVQLFSSRMGKRIRSIAPQVVASLQSYSWPGNIRELEQVIEGEVSMASIVSQSLDHVPVMLEVSRNRATAATTATTDANVKTMTESERDLLESALVAHRGKIPDVAIALGVSRGTVYNKMKKFNLDPEDYRASAP